MTTSDVDIDWEPLSTLRDDGIEELVRAEYEEVSVKDPDMPLSLDWDKYHQLEDLNILKVLGARRGADLIGYNAFIVLPHIHYSQTIHALNDAIYVKPTERGVVGLRLILEAEKKFEPPIRVVYYAKDNIIFGAASSTDGIDSLDMANEAVEIMNRYNITLPLDPLPESGSLGDLLAYLGYAKFETAYGKFIRGG